VKRVQYDRYGGPAVMRLAEFEPARPGPDEARELGVEPVVGFGLAPAAPRGW
jgi:hypothetical protein